jgi:hypothetical protein
VAVVAVEQMLLTVVAVAPLELIGLLQLTLQQLVQVAAAVAVVEERAVLVTLLPVVYMVVEVVAVSVLVALVVKVLLYLHTYPPQQCIGLAVQVLGIPLQKQTGHLLQVALVVKVYQHQ